MIKKKITVFNLGCKVNQYECDILAEKLIDKGYEVSQDLCFSDIYVLNTCAVTSEAERKSRQAVARCKALNPEAKILICGCASQNSPESFKKDGVTYISGTANKNELINHIEDLEIYTNIDALPLKYEENTLENPHRTRAFVKIQDGCNNFCSYCLIPYLRGRNRSANPENVLNEIRGLSKKTKEIVLTGIDLMSYGKDIGTDLNSLIKSLSELDIRIRLGSVYAEKITEELLDSLYSLDNFCSHFHLSLQSGDNDVLKSMNRHYTTDIYSDKIELIRKYDKNAGITTDIIVGFPTETEERFINTCKFVQDMKFSDLHIFPFSARSGTKAASMKKIDSFIVKERKKIMSNIKCDLKNRFLIENIGITHKILFEENSDGYNFGYSGNYIKIYTKKEGEIIKTTPNKLYKDGLLEE